MNDLRWNPNVMFTDGKIEEFWKQHFSSEHKLLLVLGKGFDARMNLTLLRLMYIQPNLKIECILVEFDEGNSSPSHKYQSLVDENMTEFHKIIAGKNFEIKKIPVRGGSASKSRIVMDRKATGIIGSFKEIEKYTDIIIDISAMPRGLYFSLIGKVLSLLDKNPDKKQNLFISVAENVEIDALIQESEIEEDLTYLHGFGGNIDLESEKEKPLIWFPILGEQKLAHVNKGAGKIMEDVNRLYEICPILPFPSKHPRRSDALLMEYHELLFDTLDIEPQNIMYTMERDPFQTYVQISNAIMNYQESLDVIKGCKVALSTFSSKLLSIGTLLVAYEHQEFVGILNVNSGGYTIIDEAKMKTLKNESELFVTWLTGSPYNH